MTDLSRQIGRAYGTGAEAWEAGPERMYRLLAQALVATSPARLAGRLVLDLGAGTGAATHALRSVGAHPVGTDIAWGMLAHRRRERPPGVVADVATLPFTGAVFGAVVQAFVINHQEDPAAGLRECTRVLQPGGVLLASTFPADAHHPARDVVDRVLDRHGYRRPDWYHAFRERIAPMTGSTRALTDLAERAGLVGVSAREESVEVGLDDPERAVEWRLNMAHTIDFLHRLDAHAAEALRADAVAALPPAMPSTIPVLFLAARVPSRA